MKIGLLLGALQTAPELGRMARLAEDLGFASLWMGDHVSFPAPILDPFEGLACFASHTERITLGTCVYLVPLRHPTTVAKQVASIDFLSAGRFVFGVGVGGEFPGEFAASGVPVNERGRRANEAIEICRLLWSGKEERYDGKVFDVQPTRLAPLPAREGGPPVWVGGRSDAALRRTARLGDGYVGYLLDPEKFSGRMEKIREQATAAGRREPLTGALMAFSRIDPDRDTALRQVAGALEAMYARPMEKAAGRYAVAGDLERCRQQVAAFAEAGVDHLILSPFAQGKDLEKQLEQLSKLL